MPKWAKILLGIVAVVIVIVAGFFIYRNTAYISKEEVKTTLAEKINVDKDDIHFDNVELEMEKDQYEIDFYYHNNEYEAKIDAKDGALIYTDFPITNNDNNGVDLYSMTSLCLQAIKEQQEIINDLQERIKKLEEEIKK